MRILPAEEVPEIIEKALSLCPEITTVGIAGPGEALASPHAIRAFSLTDRHFPGLIKCLSTNGLMLPKRVSELVSVHLDSVTVTVNAVDPAIQARINDGIRYGGRFIGGIRAAQILIENQLTGIRMAADAGILVKINTVLIPGVNDGHIEEIAKETAGAGAVIHNIIPLIPQAGMADFPAPGCAAIDRAREAAGKYMDVFRHCRHCRADAAGRLGKEDFGKELYGARVFEEQPFSHG